MYRLGVMVMKVLIVDDNVAIQAVVKDVLIEADYEVDIVDSTKDAIEKIKKSPPQLVLLDVDMEGGDGLKILPEIDKLQITTKFGILALYTMSETLPSDTPYLVGSISKPFRSEDILNSVELFDTIVEPVEPRKQKKETRKERKEPVKASSESRLFFGDSYVLFDDNPKEVYAATGAFASEGYEALLITSGRLKVVKEKFRDINNVDIVSLSSKTKEGYLDVYKLGSMIKTVNEFIDGHERPVIAFDNLNVLIDKRDTNSVISMIYQIVKSKHDVKFTVIVALEPRDMTDKDKDILTSCMTYYAAPEEKK